MTKEYFVDFLDQNQPKSEKSSEGFLTFMATVARIGVQTYVNDAGLEIHKYRAENEVANLESLQTFANHPVSLLHPVDGKITPDNAKQHTVGFTHSNVIYDKGFVRVGITLTDKEAIEAVESGQCKELSAGYEADIINAPGIWNGQQYDSIQKNIRINHVALVPLGRAGHECKVHLDSGNIENVFVEKNIDVTTLQHNTLELFTNDLLPKNENETMVTEKPNSDTVHDPTAPYKLMLDSANGELAALRLSLQDANEQLKSLKNTTIPKSELSELVKFRVALERDALTVLDNANLTGLSDVEIKRNVVTKRYGSRIDLNGKSDEYISNVYDAALVELVASKEATPTSITDSVPTVQPNTGKPPTIVTDADIEDSDEDIRRKFSERAKLKASSPLGAK